MIVWLHVLFGGTWTIGRDFRMAARFGMTFPISGFLSETDPTFLAPPAARVHSAGQTVYSGSSDHAKGRGEVRCKHQDSRRCFTTVTQNARQLQRS